jgi:hypothetical protein
MLEKQKTFWFGALALLASYVIARAGLGWTNDAMILWHGIVSVVFGFGGIMAMFVAAIGD